MLIKSPSRRTRERIKSLLGREVKEFVDLTAGKHYLEMTETEFTFLKDNLPKYCVSTVRMATPKNELIACWMTM